MTKNATLPKTKEPKIITMKLRDIHFDDKLIEMRPVDSATVSRYCRAMRLDGLDGFPLIILDKDTDKIVSGNQRYTAMLKEFGEDYEISVKIRGYDNRAELVEHAVTENLKFGRELTGFEAKRFRKALYELNVPVERIAQLFNKTSKAIKSELAGLTIITIGKSKTKKKKMVKIKGDNVQRKEPTKRSIPSCVTEMTESQWVEHKEKDVGVMLPLLAEQIIRHLENDFINDSYIPVLKRLQLALNNYLKNIK